MSYTQQLIAGALTGDRCSRRILDAVFVSGGCTLLATYPLDFARVRLSADVLQLLLLLYNILNNIIIQLLMTINLTCLKLR